MFRNDVSLTEGVKPGADKSPARLISSEWHVDFEIPDFHTFSGNVKEAIDSAGSQNWDSTNRNNSSSSYLYAISHYFTKL